MGRHVFILLSGIWFSFGYSQTIYQKDALTILADSLTTVGSYKQAIAVRDQAIKKHKNASIDYKAYLQAKYYHAKSCDYEFDSYNYYRPDENITKQVQQQYLDSAFQSALKARDLLHGMDHPDRMFQYQIQSRVYHQTAYLDNWKHALVQAKLGYDFLNDTLASSDKILVDLIYDIGYIYGQLGDYSKSVENYQRSLDLYIETIGENNFDVGLSYHNIALQYRNLGLRKKELESFLKAQTIWESLPEESVQTFLYKCYRNLFYWYSYYGAFEKAEGYILKKNNLRTLAANRKTNVFFRNDEEIYEDKLSEWYDLMLHYSRKNDTAQTLSNIENITKTINLDEKSFRFETQILSSTLKLYASILEHENPEKALTTLDKAIDIQQKYKEAFYTKPQEYQFYKIKLLLKVGRFVEVDLLLADLNNRNDFTELNTKFELALLNAKAAQAFDTNKNAQVYYDDAFSLLENPDDLKVTSEDQAIKELVSFEIIEGVLEMGDFYLNLYKNGKSKKYFEKASRRYLLASKIYSQLYLGERYNERLYKTYNAINERLLQLASLEASKDEDLLAQIINVIENNGSKLTWSRFVFNNQRQELGASDIYINQEESVKAELNFYQNALLKADENSGEKIMVWKSKIHDLKVELSKIQQAIKQENNTYYQLNIKPFDVAKLQESLKNEEQILRYVLTDKHLYAVLISRDKIELLPEIDRETALDSLKVCLDHLKQRHPDYKSSFNEMHNVMFANVDLNAIRKLTIIPDGAFNYFPFEVLLLDQKRASVSYASSLLLLQEQKRTISNFDKIYIGAFSASNNRNKLPRATEEINAIFRIFEGKSYPNASKKEFLQNVADFNILHLAMHSHIDEMQPEFSSLNFYGENDNQLFISELYNESLDADLAVLSACDTGSGFYENGEGVISLSRAFSYAGVPSTVVSLWKVDDEATAKIMTYFYQHLKKGETKDEALKYAKLDYLKLTDDDLLKHPYYWSGFVLSGNTDALVEKQYYWIYLAVLPFLALGFFRKQLFQFFKK